MCLSVELSNKVPRPDPKKQAPMSMPALQSHCCLRIVSPQTRSQTTPIQGLRGGWACQVHSLPFQGLGKNRGSGIQQCFSAPSSAPSSVTSTSALQTKSAVLESSPEQEGSKLACHLGGQVQVPTEKHRDSHQNAAGWTETTRLDQEKIFLCLGSYKECAKSPGSNFWVESEQRLDTSLIPLLVITELCAVAGENVSFWSCLISYTWLNIHWTKEEDWLTGQILRKH